MVASWGHPRQHPGFRSWLMFGRYQYVVRLIVVYLHWYVFFMVYYSNILAKSWSRLGSQHPGIILVIWACEGPQRGEILVFPRLKLNILVAWGWLGCNILFFSSTIFSTYVYDERILNVLYKVNIFACYNAMHSEDNNTQPIVRVNNSYLLWDSRRIMTSAVFIQSCLRSRIKDIVLEQLHQVEWQYRWSNHTVWLDQGAVLLRK